MNDLKGLRAVVAGAGAIGSVLAVTLARRGAEVILADPAAAGDNASGVAAGMLAPAFEILLDPMPAHLYPLLRAARDAWPEVMRALPSAPPLDRSGALFKPAAGASAEAMLGRLTDLGADGRLIGSAEAQSLAPGLVGEDDVYLFTPEDWRLDAAAALGALHDAFDRLGGRRLALAATGFEDGQVRFAGAEPVGADVVILATGPKASGWPAAIGDERLTPIKGQILRFPGFGPATGPVVRAPGVYVTPSVGGWVVGATMEPGRSDRAIDPDAVEGLRTAAAALFPALADAPFIAAAGVRAATADGVPLVGPSGQAGVLLARGARRNGWLLAPLIAEVVVDRLLGRAPGAAAQAFDPARS